MDRVRMKGLPFDTDHENELGFAGNVKFAFLLREAGQANLLALCMAIFLTMISESVLHV